MAIVTYRRSDSIKNIGARLLTSEGYVDVGQSRMLSQFTKALSSALESDYNAIYNLAQNIDIGSATGDYLDRWGRILGVSREKNSVVTDLTLSNAKISISPAINAGALTVGSLPLIIPRGTKLGNGTDWFLSTIDTVAIDPTSNAIYVRVAATSTSITSISTNDITDVNLTLSQLPGVNTAILSSYKLVASLEKDISGTKSILTDNEYRYTLQQRASSIGLFNENTINSILNIDGIADIYVREYYGGIDVYIEPTDISLAEQSLEIARSVLENGKYGTAVNVFLPRFRNVKAVVQLDLKEVDPSAVDASVIPSILSDAINNTKMGSVIDLESIISTSVMPYLSSNVEGCKIISASYNLRKVVGSSISQNFNEKATTLPENIQVTV